MGDKRNWRDSSAELHYGTWARVQGQLFVNFDVETYDLMGLNLLVN
jgi:hypothetical protein